MSLLKPAVYLVFLMTLGLSFPSQANTPPALSTPSASPEAPLGPEYFGALTGEASVSAAGNASYVIPIEVPPGTRGMVPPISLNYNSNMRNGLLGLGWFMSGPTSRITRCPQTVSQDGISHIVDYSADDRFCLDGHRLVLESGTYGSVGAEYRTETNSFVRVISYGTAGTGPSYFVIETKDGMTKYYGYTADSKIEAQGMTTVGVWALNRVEDAAGNYYAITYHEDNSEGEFYPIQIDYTGNDSAGLFPNAMVEFTYEDRPDSKVRYQGGAKITDHPKRLSAIKTYVDLALVSDYQLTYEIIGIGDDGFNAPYPDVGRQSRLTQIDRCDAQGNCQDPVILEWLQDNYSGNYNDVDFGTGPGEYYRIDVPDDRDRYAGFQHRPESGTRWHDLNGDGTPDFIIPITQDGGWISSGNIFRYNGDFEVKLSSPTGYQTTSWTGGYDTRTWILMDQHWADIDGDGRTDLVTVDGRAGASGTHQIHVSLSTGTGFNTQLWVTHVESASYDDDMQISFRDMNGDKLLDMVVHEVEGAHPAWQDFCLDGSTSTIEDSSVSVYLNTGTGFGAQQIWANETNTVIDLADMNGDGLTDLVLNATDVRLNDGTGFGTTTNWPTAGVTGCSTVVLVDYNGDGKTDRLWEDDDSLHINAGGAFIDTGREPDNVPSVDFNGDGMRDAFTRAADASSVQIDAYMGLDDILEASEKDRVVSTSSDYDMRGILQVADMDGDGIHELVLGETRFCTTNGMTFGGVYRRYVCAEDSMLVFRTLLTHPHLLKTVTTGRGADVSFTYSPLTDHSIYTKYNTSTLPELDVQDGTHVVTTITQDDGIGGTFDINYKYEGLKRDLDGRGLLGFAKISIDNTRDGTTSITEYAQNFPYSSRPTRSETRRTSDGQLLNSTDTTYSLYGTVGAGTVFPYVDTQTAKAYELSDGRLLSTTTTTNTVDMYGNITDSVVEIVDHENSDTFKTQTLSTYTIDVSNWRVGQLTSQTTKAWRNGSYSSGLDRTNDFTYFSSTGFLKDTIQEPGKGTGIEFTKSLTYDSFGNVLTETVSGPGLASRVTSMLYDFRGQFAETVTNPLGHVLSRTWDADFGNKLTDTDANGITTSWTYNGFGQQVFEYRPDGTSTEIRIYEDNSGLNGAVLYTEVLSTGKAPARAFSDIFGRTVKARTQGFDGSYINQLTEFDSQGRVDRTSELYFDGDTVYWNINTYDFLGRVTAVTAADSVKSVTSTYNGYSVTITDNMNRSKTQTTNAVGQIITVIDRMGTEMNFDYDPVGNRIKVTNAAGTAQQNDVVYTYDRLGRMLTQDDPDHGLYTYTYDALGQKLTEQTPKMAAVTPTAPQMSFTYDKLGRMTSRTEPEGTTTWVYDNIAGGNLGKGQLHSESSPGFSRSYAYGAGNHGRMTGTTTVIGSRTFNTGMSYNSHGQIAIETYPASISNPSGFQVEYTYNALGFQERVQAPGGSTVYYQMLSADASGRMTSEWLGDGSTAVQAYEAASSRINSQHTTNGATNVQQFTYTYDDAGNMLTRDDVRASLTETFTFDDLDRLTGATVTGQTPATYAFDRLGNITSKSDTGTPYAYTGNQMHAVNTITVGGITQSLSYDDNGNLNSGDDVPTITWSSYNKPTQLTKGGITYDFYYGSDRKRYKKVKGTETTYYVGGAFEQIEKTTSTEYRHVIRANGKAIMLRKDYSSGTQGHEYVHRDHLGSVTALTAESTGNIIERYSYDAWGQRRNADTWAAATVATPHEKRGYTGHEHLDDIGIVHINGRIYDPRLGRMLSPDPITQEPENGQNYNRYTYAYNNPLRYTDPSGYCTDLVTASQCIGAIYSIYNVFNGGLFGGNGCDRTCKERHAAHNWCKAQSACLAELRANTREKFRRRSAQVIMEAVLTGQSYYYENGRAYLGDSTTGEEGSLVVPIVPIKSDEPDEPRKRVVAFVGGAMDSTFGLVKGKAELHGGTYFEWTQGEELAAWIDANAGNEIVVIGHSYGGDTAAGVVADGHYVDVLKTVDPVGWLRPDFDDVAANSGHWVNYDSAGTGISWVNFVGTVGGAYNDSPEGYADEHHSVALDHVAICSAHCNP